MPIVTPEKYAEMLDTAKANVFAFPAINVSSSQTLNAALKGFADAGSDGIIQVSTGGADYLSGPTSRTWCPARSRSRRTPPRSPRTTRSTSRCTPTTARRTSSTASSARCSTISSERVARGEAPFFQSHMWDGSAVPLDENLVIAEELLDRCIKAKVILEIEVGVVGGEEDGIEAEINDKLTRPRGRHRDREGARVRRPRLYMTALTFGNVHGVYKPGNVKLRPEVLKEAQEAVVARVRSRRRREAVPPGLPRRIGLVAEEIAAAVDFGVVKMNVDTDTQYAFTRPVAAHMFQNYDGVLKVDGEVGNKKAYDPRAWGKAGEAGMAARSSRRASTCARPAPRSADRPQRRIIRKRTAAVSVRRWGRAHRAGLRIRRASAFSEKARR